MIEEAPAVTVNLSVISHTNAGKTTLVRTLLGQDIGEVRDAAHVTDVATGYLMLQDGGDALMLWDTPGFGDTARLLKRLKLSANPLGWFLTQVWDRWRERPLWSSQQAVRNARDQADTILYLVNASEDPADAGYVGLEMEILAWVGKPVLLLLNQTGRPSPSSAAEEERWTRHLAAYPVVKGALTLDAFARCWVQEATLLRMVRPLLSVEKSSALVRLERAWEEKSLERFDRSMEALAKQLAESASDREIVPDQNWQDKVGGAIRTLGREEPPEARRAVAKLAERLETGTRRSTEELIKLHSLSGKATAEVLRRIGTDVSTSGPAREGFSAMLGGLASGALGGLAADVAAGGLTLGGGMIIGGILGAIGAGSLARGYNLVRGEAEPAVRWSHDFFQSLVRLALLRYLAVAHFGRGRGDYQESEHPDFWQAAVAETVERHQGEIRAIWERSKSVDAPVQTAPLKAVLTAAATELLMRFYPDSKPLLTRTRQIAEAPEPGR
ncbi:MAG TPA: GTPase domain-containing protein [Allosphingosinicella sp.]|nr:GTPase domain-containing protein [Allosphingosinicella sp.]